MALSALARIFKRTPSLPTSYDPDSTPVPHGERIGVIAGNGRLPLRFCADAKRHECSIVAVCHTDETLPEIEQAVEKAVWIKVGELGRMISAFRESGITKVAMVGGINRVRLFGGVKLDVRGATLLMRLRSTKDDVIMRGIADELAGEGIETIDSAIFMREMLVREGLYTRSAPTKDEETDIEVGRAALRAMSEQHIGQLVVVRDGVVVAVEAVEGSDAAIRRGGELGGVGTVVVKCAKPGQDMRFDIPIIGAQTLETLRSAAVRVLAIEAGRCLLLDQEAVIQVANENRISIIGCPPLVAPAAGK